MIDFLLVLLFLMEAKSLQRDGDKSCPTSYVYELFIGGLFKFWKACNAMKNAQVFLLFETETYNQKDNSTRHSI